MATPPHETTCVLLGAGAGSRFSGPVHKLLAPLRGVPVVTHAVRAMRAAAGEDCFVVTGAETSQGFIAALEGTAVVRNDDWRTGMRGSVVTAIETARARGSRQVVIGLADQPFVTADAWRAVASADSPLAVATYAGKRGNPVKLRDDTWEAFLGTPGRPDEGARSFVNMHPELVLEVACQGSSDDIDTNEDLARWI